MSGHAGIPWGRDWAPDAGTVAERRATVHDMAKYREWFAPMDGSLDTTPETATWAAEANPSCAVGMSRNMWACFQEPSDYFPSHVPLADLCDELNLWLRDANGNILPKTSGGLRRFDIRHPRLHNLFINQTRSLFQLYRCSFLFADEPYDHTYVTSVTGIDVSQPIPGVQDSLGWNDAIRLMFRKIGQKVVTNGTFPLDQSAMICGTYIQNAHLKANLLDRLKDSVLRGYTRTCIQVPVARSLEFLEIAARFQGVSIQEIPATGGQFDFPPPAVYCEPGTKLTKDGETIIVGRA